MSSIKDHPAKVATPSLRSVGTTLFSRFWEPSSARELPESGSTTQSQSRVKQIIQKFTGPSSQRSHPPSFDNSPPPSVSTKEERRTPTPPSGTRDVNPADTTQQAHNVAMADPMNKSGEQSVSVVRLQNATPSVVSGHTVDASQQRPTTELASPNNAPSHHSGKAKQSRGSAIWTRPKNVLTRNANGGASQCDPGLRDSSVQVKRSSVSTNGSGGTPRSHQKPSSPTGATSRQGLTVGETSTHLAPAPNQEESTDVDVMGKELARRCWEGDNIFLAKDEVAGWLGRQSPMNKIALRHYLGFFNFSGLRLDLAFRLLCSKLHFKAEIQQVDRILEEFGRRYWECNPESIFGSGGVVHAISYSLVLLNKDFHVSETTDGTSIAQFVHDAIATAQVQHQSSADPRDASDSGSGSISSLASSTHLSPHIVPPAVTLKDPNMSALIPSSLTMKISHPLEPGPFSAEQPSTIPSIAAPSRGSTRLHPQRPSIATTSTPSLVPGGHDGGHSPSGQEFTVDSSRLTSDHLPTQEGSGDIDMRGKDLARRCWEEDEEFLARDKITEWLSEQRPVNKIALQHYLRFFDFTDLRLDEAFRRLCKKLYLKAETQQVDRILEEFGKRYWECNPTTIFHSAPVAHVVSYSLLLLNTDLHVAELTSRMSRGQFVHNTMDSIHKKLQLPTSPSSESETSVLGEEWEHQAKRVLKDIYNATKSKQIILDSTYVSPPPAPPPDEVLSDTAKHFGFASILSQKDITDEDLALLGPPWAKEGKLSRRSYKESPEKGKKSEEWVDIFAVVQKGELLMFKFGGHDAGRSDTMGDGNWADNAKPVGELQLVHSYAQARPPPGYTNQRQNCMALTLADGSVYFFQAGTDEHMEEWVSTCNYWAARQSKEPLPGVSNVEYGWSRIRSVPEDKGTTPDLAIDPGALSSRSNRQAARPPRNDRVTISDWEPPIQSSVASARNGQSQLVAVEKHLSTLETQLEKHFELRKPMMKLYTPHLSNAVKVQENWTKCASYLQGEVFKYSLYAESLRSAMETRGRLSESGEST